MFKIPFSFSGRIRRSEFGLSYLLYLVSIGLLGYAMEDETTYASMAVLILVIPLFWFFLAQAVKRCHDLGNTGFYVLIPFYIFWLLFADGEFGNNKYGPNPKGIGNYDEVDELGKHLLP